MNKKQMVVLWAMILLLSIAAIVEGSQTDDVLIGLGGPALLIGVTLLYQFRDKSVSPPLTRTKQLLLVVVGLLLVQTLLVFAEGRQLRQAKASVQHLEGYLDSISTDVSTIQSDVSTLQTDVSEIETNVGNLER
jgi:peptidoglycan hydrolase CwlO-like protein